MLNTVNLAIILKMRNSFVTLDKIVRRGDSITVCMSPFLRNKIFILPVLTLTSQFFEPEQLPTILLRKFNTSDSNNELNQIKRSTHITLPEIANVSPLSNSRGKFRGAKGFNKGII